MTRCNRTCYPYRLRRCGYTAWFVEDRRTGRVLDFHWRNEADAVRWRDESNAEYRRIQRGQLSPST